LNFSLPPSTPTSAGVASTVRGKADRICAKRRTYYKCSARMGCRGEYLDIRRREGQEPGENCVMGVSFFVSRSSPRIIRWFIWAVHVPCTGEERNILKDFVGKTEENRTLAIPRSR